MVWAIISGVIVLMSAASFGLAVKAGMIGTGYFASTPVAGYSVSLSSENNSSNELMYTVVAWICIVTTLVLFVTILFMRHKVNVCVGILKESCKCLSSIPLLMLWPIVPSVMFVILFIYWSVIAAYIASSGSEGLADYANSKVQTATDSANAQGASAGLNNTLTFKSFEASNASTYMSMFHLFGFLWTNQLIQAISMCTVAGSVNKYYWARDKSEMSSRPIRIAFYNAIRYHFGSLVFGSLIIAIVQFIRLVLAYIDQKTKKLQRANPLVMIFMKCVQCCMWCMEKCLKYISKSAYIMIAMKGGSFCTSTRRAVGLLFDNLSQIALANTIVTFMLLLAEICISIICGMVFYWTISNNEDFKEGGINELSSPMVPVCLVFIIAWFISDKFMGLFGNIVDSTLMMFCVDKAENKGTDDGYFMSDSLAKLLGENKAKKAAKQAEKAEKAEKEAEVSEAAPAEKGGECAT